MTDTLPASRIAVADFRLILQWPLILEVEAGPGLTRRLTDEVVATRQALSRCKWTATSGLEMLADTVDIAKCPPKSEKDLEEARQSNREAREAAADASYGEFAYFHDFLQGVLYPRTGDATVSIWEKRDITGLTAVLSTDDKGSTDTLHFSVLRRTIHLYSFGCALVTVELQHRPDENPPLTLDRVQRALDHLRRSSAPYFKDGKAGRCPVSITLHKGAASKPCPIPGEAEVMKDWREAREKDHRDMPVFGHWQDLIAPLKLRAQRGPWRDPSDERISINSFIRLAGVPGMTDAQVLRQVHRSDWVRIADAEEPTDKPKPDESWPYNRDFCRKTYEPFYYDRFYSDPAAPLSGTRHLFGGAHYSVVGAGGFFAGLISDHFRRHYTQMSLVARLEFSSLLAVSSRLTRAVQRRDNAPAGNARTQQEFEAEVLDIQDQFLTFVHRFRFTGVSSQVQAREMYALWRQSLGLAETFAEVKDELDAAVAAIRARQTERETQATTNLTRVATIGGVLGLFLAALAVQAAFEPLIGCEEWRGGWGNLGLIALFVTAGAGIPAGGLAMGLGWKGRTWGIALMAGALAAMALVLWGGNDPGWNSGAGRGHCTGEQGKTAESKEESRNVITENLQAAEDDIVFRLISAVSDG